MCFPAAGAGHAALHGAADLNQKHGSVLAHGSYSNMKTSFDDMGENIATHRTLWHNVVKEPSKTASSGTELAPAMIPAIAPLRAIVDAIKPFKSGWMFPS